MRNKEAILEGFDDKTHATLEFCKLEAFIDIRDLLGLIYDELRESNRLNLLSKGIDRRNLNV